MWGRRHNTPRPVATRERPRFNPKSVWTSCRGAIPTPGPLLDSMARRLGPRGGHTMESSQVINHLVRTSGVAVHEATAFVEAVHEIVEEMVTDDVSVIAPPL